MANVAPDEGWEPEPTRARDEQVTDQYLRVPDDEPLRPARKHTPVPLRASLRPPFPPPETAPSNAISSQLHWLRPHALCTVDGIPRGPDGDAVARRLVDAGVTLVVSLYESPPPLPALIRHGVRGTHLPASAFHTSNVAAIEAATHNAVAEIRAGGVVCVEAVAGTSALSALAPPTSSRAPTSSPSRRCSRSPVASPTTATTTSRRC